MSAYRLTPLHELEAESIHAFRGVVAEFERFAPTPPLFPVLFIDTARYL
ncbi:MAG: hypothetical protein JKY65_14395 [Planctomycetes bacterium]|nr:hypothetical protein [Planctomycetota bacterium]